MIFTFLLSSSWCSRCRRLRELQATAGLLERFSGSTLNCTGARLVSSVTRLQSTLELRLASRCWSTVVPSAAPAIDKHHIRSTLVPDLFTPPPPACNQYVPLCTGGQDSSHCRRKRGETARQFADCYCFYCISEL